jgi:hypothetical protein
MEIRAICWLTALIRVSRIAFKKPRMWFVRHEPGRRGKIIELINGYFGNCTLVCNNLELSTFRHQLIPITLCQNHTSTVSKPYTAKN